MITSLRPIKPPQRIFIRNPRGDGPATLDFHNPEMGYWVATVPGDGPIATRRVFLINPQTWYAA